MTATLDTPTRTPARNPANDEIVLIATYSGERIGFTAMQIVDIVACYLAGGGHFPDDPADPYAPMQLIREEALWGNVEGWVCATEAIALHEYRTRALAWIHDYFGTGYPEVTW